MPCLCLNLLFLAFPAIFSNLEARPKIALVLSGGGARGIAHVGVLREFEKHRIPIDIITGTSIGSIVGGLYASGYSVDELETEFRKTDWNDVLFNDRIPRRQLPLRRKMDFEKYPFNFEIGFDGTSFNLPPGLVYGQKFGSLLDEFFLRVADIRDFSKLPVPFKAVASDIESGKAVVLEKGYLPDAIKASAAYPGLFSPVQLDGHLLLDGGATNNVPVDLAKKMGADLIIAVDVSLFLKTKDKLKSVFEVMEQMITIMLQYTTTRQTDNAHYVIKPDVGKADLFFVENYEELVQAGKVASIPILKKIQKYSLSEADYQRWDQKRRSHHFSPGVIDEVRGPEKLTESLRFKKGSNFNLKKLKEDIRRIYSAGDYETVDYKLSLENEKTILEIRSKEKSWGPHFIRFYATWDGEVQGQQDGNAITNVRATQINSLNAEWITDVSMGTHLEFNSEFYQPLDPRGLFFVAPRLILSRGDEDYYLDTDRVAEYEVDVVIGGLDGGLALGPIGELRFGIRRGFLNSEIEVGVAPQPSYEVQTAAWLGRFRIDQLDSAYYPTRGVYGACDYLSSHDRFGATDSYRKLACQLHGFISFQPFTFFIQSYAGTNLNSSLPLYDEFYLGGFRSFSGFRQGEMRGQHFAVGRAGSRWRLPMPKTIFWDRMFLGAWAEAGNVFQHRDQIDLNHLRYSGTASLEFETKIGAVSVAYGQSGTSHKQFYMSAGRTFGIQDFLRNYD